MRALDLFCFSLVIIMTVVMCPFFFARAVLEGELVFGILHLLAIGLSVWVAREFATEVFNRK